MRKNSAEKQISSAEEYSARILEDAEKEADSRKKELLVEAKGEILKLRSDQESENKEQRREIKKLEDRIVQKELNIEKKAIP